MKRILTDAANIGAVTARTITYMMRDKGAYYYPNSSWRLPFLGGYRFEVAPGVSNLNLSPQNERGVKSKASSGTRPFRVGQR